MQTVHERRLTTPKPLRKGALRITPMGGLGEIGRNMTVFEFGGRLLVVDCGVLFPEDHQPGIDVIIPDFA
ncbi:MAG: RNase J family beta-CASP ribonuclease, partial [Cellulomonas sp.]|nr:RNase J family beta-CASP ribonuclease [Cellulomonas sp.]